MGRVRTDIEEGLRGLLVRPYILFYCIEADEIVVIRILHGKRDLRQTMVDEN